MPFCLRLSREAYQAMLLQATNAFPLECCGLLAGIISPADPGALSEPLGTVLGRYPLRNVAESGILFQADPRSVFAVSRDIDCRDWQLLAVYHSHPTSAPLPSKTDLELHFDPAVMAVIISLADAEPLLRAWWLHEDRFHEARWQVVE